MRVRTGSRIDKDAVALAGPQCLAKEQVIQDAFAPLPKDDGKFFIVQVTMDLKLYRKHSWRRRACPIEAKRPKGTPDARLPPLSGFASYFWPLPPFASFTSTSAAVIV